MKKLLGVTVLLILVGVFLSLSIFMRSRPHLAKSPETPPAQPTRMSVNTCPEGYVLVPGNSTYHTSDFCVMKYDAKCADSSKSSVGLAPKPGAVCSGLSVSGGYAGVYKNNGSGCGCVPQNSKQVVSTSSGFPITYIAMSDATKNNAKALCLSVGGHVITNPEWMTIARNVEQVSQNWCDPNGTNCGFPPGTKGKILASGHGDGENEASASAGGIGALIASDDSKPCFGTTTDGSNMCGGISSQKRTLQLTNGFVLWDFAGNVWQWVDAQVMRKDQPKSSSQGVADSGWLKSDFAPGSLPSVLTDNGYGPTLGYDAFRPSNPTWNATNGVGRIYHYGTIGDTSTILYAFIRGGNWRHFDDDGAFTIHLSPPEYTENIDDVGFRCVKSL